METLVVADTKMVEYHGQPQVESYVLTIMNMVRLRRAAGVWGPGSWGVVGGAGQLGVRWGGRSGAVGSGRADPRLSGPLVAGGHLLGEGLPFGPGPGSFLPPCAGSQDTGIHCVSPILEGGLALTLTGL